MRYAILVLALIQATSAPLVWKPPQEDWSNQEDFKVDELSPEEIRVLKDGQEKFDKAKAEWEQLQLQIRRQHGETFNDWSTWCGEVRQRDVVLRGKYALITIHPSHSCISW